MGWKKNSLQYPLIFGHFFGVRMSLHFYSRSARDGHFAATPATPIPSMGLVYLITYI